MTETFISELADYKLVVDDSIEREGSRAYQIVNKQYGVVETETFILPQAQDYLEQLQAALDAAEDMAVADEEEMAEVAGEVLKYSH